MSTSTKPKRTSKKPKSTSTRDTSRLDSLRKSMWSIQYHSLYLPRLGDSLISRLDIDPEVRATITPEDLPRAIETISEDHDEHDRARRRRALYSLCAAGLANSDRINQLISAQPSGKYDGRIRRVKETLAAMRRLAECLNVDIRLIENVAPNATASALDGLIGFVGGECEVVETGCATCFDARARTLTTTATANVHRQFWDMKRAMDPRCWDECSDVFLETHTVESDGAGGYPSVDLNIPKGEPWSGLLYEKVYAGGLIYENILDIDFLVSAHAVTVDYKLHASISPINGGLEIDDGYMTAANAIGKPGWSQLTMVKTVWFDDLTGTGGPWDLGELPNWFAPAILCLWLKDITGNGPCCDPA